MSSPPPVNKGRRDAPDPGSGFSRRSPILLSLLAIFAFVALVPLASIAWKLIQLNREVIFTAQQENQLLLASAVAGELDARVRAQRDRVADVAETMGEAWVRRGRIRQHDVDRALEELGAGAFSAVRFTDRRGRAVAAAVPEADREALETVLASAWSLAAERIDARDGSTRGDAAWISAPRVIDEQTGAAVFVATAPVLAGNRVVGALSGVVELGELWDVVTSRHRTGQTVFATDAIGTLFATTDPRTVAIGSDMRGCPIVERFRTARGLARETLPFEWARDDHFSEHFLGSYELTNDGWGVFVLAREGDVYLPARTMTERTLTRVLLVLSLVLLASVMFARSITNPIHRLAAATRGFARGDYSVRFDVRSRNELGQLGDTFNRMADEIQGQIREAERRAHENAELFLGTIRALANAIDAKDRYTRGHSVRVNRYAVIIARTMGLSRSEIDEIHVASVLHDVGKIGIRESILNKPGALTPEEFQTMKTHTTRGAEIMEPIRQMRKIVPGLRSHHERWNGTGYPDGLAGEQIPLMGRIIAVADTFDAMTTHRPYQRAFTFDQAVAKINSLKNVSFDERVVEAFNRAYEAGEFGSEPETLDPVASEDAASDTPGASEGERPDRAATA